MGDPWTGPPGPDHDVIGLLKEQMASQESRHLAEIERLVGQFHAERSFWTERCDAAECRAEQASQRADERVAAAERLALDALTQAAETAERITAAMIQATDRPLWRRLFG